MGSCYDTAPHAGRVGMGVHDADAPYLSVPVLTELLGTLMASKSTSLGSAHSESLSDGEKGGEAAAQTRDMHHVLFQECWDKCYLVNDFRNPIIGKAGSGGIR